MKRKIIAHVLLLVIMVSVFSGCTKKKHIMYGKELFGIDRCDSIELRLGAGSDTRVIEDAEEAGGLLDLILSLEYTPKDITPLEGGRVMKINTPDGDVSVTFYSNYAYFKGQYYELNQEIGETLYKYQNYLNMKEAEAETVKMAGEIVDSLSAAYVFDAAVIENPDAQYADARNIAPGLSELETKEDAAIALLTLYEALWEEAWSYDFAEYMTYVRHANDTGEEVDAENEMYIMGTDFLHRQETIEALLAFDCFYDKLSKTGVERLKKDFDNFALIIELAERKAYGYAERHTYFDIYRNALK